MKYVENGGAYTINENLIRQTDRQTITAAHDNLSYSCGTSLNLDDSEDDECTSHLDKVYPSLKLSCDAPMEIPHFGTFPNVSLCFYCGKGNGLVKNDTKDEYPICEMCKGTGKHAQKKQKR